VDTRPVKYSTASHGPRVGTGSNTPSGSAAPGGKSIHQCEGRLGRRCGRPSRRYRRSLCRSSRAGVRDATCRGGKRGDRLTAEQLGVQITDPVLSLLVDLDRDAVGFPSPATSPSDPLLAPAMENVPYLTSRETCRSGAGRRRTYKDQSRPDRAGWAFLSAAVVHAKPRFGALAIVEALWIKREWGTELSSFGSTRQG
jgi:hypothetical protein